MSGFWTHVIDLGTSNEAHTTHPRSTHFAQQASHWTRAMYIPLLPYGTCLAELGLLVAHFMDVHNDDSLSTFVNTVVKSGSELFHKAAHGKAKDRDLKLGDKSALLPSIAGDLVHSLIALTTQRGSLPPMPIIFMKPCRRPSACSVAFSASFCFKSRISICLQPANHR